MTLIRMETESVDSLIAKLKSTSNLIHDSLFQLEQTVSGMSWEGGSRDDFAASVQQVKYSLDSQLENLFQLASTLEGEKMQWLESDKSFTKISMPSDQNIISESFSGFWDSISGGFLRFPGLFKKKDIPSTFASFEESEMGQDLIQDAIDANITFRYVDENGDVFTFGAENGEVIEISWVDPADIPGSNGGYYSGPPPTIVLNEELRNGNAFEIREVVAHESQHAIDYRNGISEEVSWDPYNQIAETDFDGMTNQEINDYDWASLEADLEASCSERVKTEITAHARGYAMDPEVETGEGVLIMDGQYTPEEYAVILNDRNYKTVYADDISGQLAEQGLSADISVSWNAETNQIDVSITNVQKK